MLKIIGIFFVFNGVFQALASFAYGAVNGELSLENYQYLGDFEHHQSRSKNWIHFGLRGDAQNRYFEAKYDLDVTDVSDSDVHSNYFLPAEAYITTNWLAESLKISFGRKVLTWSELDQDWNLGLWQPRWRWDYLKPKEFGFTGVFFEMKYPAFHFLAFVSPVFIPEHGAPIQNVNGQLRSGTRWFVSPPSEFEFKTQTTGITYDVDFDEGKIVSQESFGFLTQVGDLDQGVWARMAYANKPLNQLGFDIMRNSFVDETNIYIRPRVLRHELTSMDLGYAHRYYRVTVSYLFDSVKRDRVPTQNSFKTDDHSARLFSNQEDVFYQDYDPVQVFSTKIKFPFSQLIDRYFELKYFRAFGGESRTRGDGLFVNTIQFDSRLDFNNAIGISLRERLGQIRYFPIFGEISSLYDFDQKGSIISVLTHLEATYALQFLFGFDLLSVETTDLDSRSNGFIDRYKSNDRFFVGMKYVF